MAVVNLRGFPDKLVKEAKVKAVLEGISLKDLIIKAVSQYLAKTKRKRG